MATVQNLYLVIFWGEGCDLRIRISLYEEVYGTSYCCCCWSSFLFGLGHCRRQLPLSCATDLNLNGVQRFYADVAKLDS